MILGNVRSGFTLIEMMIVLVILGLLAGIGVPAYMNYAKRAKLETTKANLKVIRDAVDNYFLQIGKYPETLEDLVRKPSDPDAAASWVGSFLRKREMPKDAWKRPFIYQVTPGDQEPYELYSKGEDGKSKITA